MRSVLGFGTAFAVLLAAGSAPAQTTATSTEAVAQADAAFNAAKALLDAGHYGDACAKFAESKRLAPGLGVTLYLADCYERIGRTASAWTEFRSAEGLARQRSDPRAEVARARAQALEPKLDRLTIVVAPTMPRTGLHVFRDGVAIAEEEWGLAMPVDPGEHVVLVSAPGGRRTLSAHLGPDNPSASVRIEGFDESPAAPPAERPPPPPPPAPAASSFPVTEPAPPEAQPSPNRGPLQRWLGIGLMGAGGVGIGVGTVFGIVAKSRLEASNGGPSPPCNANDQCNARGLSLRHDAMAAATASTIGFVVGAAVAAGGVAVYLTAPRSTSIGLTVAPSPTAGGGVALLHGSF